MNGSQTTLFETIICWYINLDAGPSTSDFEHICKFWRTIRLAVENTQRLHLDANKWKRWTCDNSICIQFSIFLVKKPVQCVTCKAPGLGEPPDCGDGIERYGDGIGFIRGVPAMFVVLSMVSRLSCSIAGGGLIAHIIDREQLEGFIRLYEDL